MLRARGERVCRGFAQRGLGIMGLGAVVVLSASGVARAAEQSGDVAPLVISHRGASADAPEHTFAAYDRAIEQHTDVLECDMQLTADEVLVCMHDTTVDRTTGGTSTGRVDAFTLEQLRAMDFGAWFGPEFAGARIVPFEEQLRCYGRVDPRLQFYAETKAPAEYGGRMEPALVKLLRRLDLVPQGPADVHTAPVIVQSFERSSLDAVKQLAPSLPTAWLWTAPPAEVTAGAIPSSVDVLAPMAEYVRAHPELVEQAHTAGRDVHTWTVDDEAVMDELLDDGVDGIFTNHTATLRARVDALTGRHARPSIDFERECPGVAGTVTAATDDAPATRSTSTTSVPAPKVPESSDSTSWVGPVIAVAVIAAAGGLGVWWLRRRRT